MAEYREEDYGHHLLHILVYCTMRCVSGSVLRVISMHSISFVTLNAYAEIDTVSIYSLFVGVTERP
jgi:hypothetical protein